MAKKPEYDRVGGGRYDIYRKRAQKNDNGWIWIVLGVIGILFLIGSCA
ncbi:MAG: hypothetical protein AAFX09_08195 [Pseudomonadota bacterium]